MRGRRRWSLAILGLALAAVAWAPPALQAQPAGSAQDAGEAGPDREWRFIEKLQADGMVDVAATQLEKFAQNFSGDPRAASAWLRAGRIHEQLGQSEAATRDYEALLEHFPSASEAPEGAFRRAELLSGAKRFEDAAKAYRSLLEAYPASDRVDAARLGLGEALMALQQDAGARPLLRGLIAGRADASVAARARYDLGVLAERADSDSLAIERFDSVAQLHPDQPIAGFALLRAAKILTARDEITAARDRYLGVLRLDTAPLLRGRARMGLAELVEDRDPQMAMDQLEALAKEGATPEQVQAALLRLGDVALRHGDRKRARQAAESFLDSFPDAPQAQRARLLAARADLGERDDAAPRLRALLDSKDREIAWEAARTLGQWEFQQKNYDEAMNTLRRAESAAPDDSLRAGVVLRQAQAAVSLSEPALAAELAQRSAELSASDEERAQAWLLAMQNLDASGRPRDAIGVGEKLLEELPRSQAAAAGSRLLESLRRRADYDPVLAAHQLATLATEPASSPAERELDVGRILREKLGDATAALEAFRRAQQSSQTPADRAASGWEISKTLQAESHDLGLKGDDSGARARFDEARRAAAEAAAQEGAETWAARARQQQLALELAAAARPDAPWLFDADRMPLLGAVGEAESDQRDTEGLHRLHDALEAGLKGAESSEDRAWWVWRAVELSDASREEREARLVDELKRRPPANRQRQLRYALGQLRLQGDDAAGAAQVLSRIVEEAPASPLATAARYALAEAHRAQKNYSVAADLYLAFAATYPRTVRGQRALLLAGDCALLSGDPALASKRYQTLIDRYPQTVYRDDAYYRLGTAQQRAGHLDAARESLRQLLDWGSGSDYRGRTLARLAKIEEEAGNDSTAVTVWRRLVDADPQRASQEKADLAIARLELGLEHYRAALSALADSSRSDEAMSIRIRALAGSGNRDKALEQWEQLRVQSVDASALAARLRCEIGERQLEAGELDRAHESFQFTAEQSPESAWKARAHYRMGVMAARARDLDTARKELSEAAAAKPGSEWTAEALYQLGSLQIREGQPELAQKSFARVFEEFPKHPKAPDALAAEALAYRHMSRFDEALKVYHRLLEEFPDYADAAKILSNIAYCHHELHQYEIAVQAYRRVMPYLDEEGQAYAEFWIADSLAGLKRYEDAAAAFLRIPYLYPDQGQLPVTAQLKAAEVYALMGNRDAAVSLYQKVIRTHGAKSQWGSEAQRRLDGLQEGQRGES